MENVFAKPVFSPVSIILAVLFSVTGCTSDSEESRDALFEAVPPAVSNVNFSNELHYDNDFNLLTYKDFYAGGGVALGDLNNDGLP
ncbi:MAG: hypothetical protein WD317_05560, partial [Balneolaceae bacterium]